MKFITLQQASDHLRRDTTADDADLTLKIEAAEAAVTSYLKSASPYLPALDENGDPALDENGDPTYTTEVRYQVQAATLLLVGILYRLRDENKDGDFQQGYLPMPVTALLYSLRDPALS